MREPRELSEMTIPELNYIVAQSRVLDGGLTQKQVTAVLMSAEACGFAVVRKDWLESVEHSGTDDVGPVLSGRPN